MGALETGEETCVHRFGAGIQLLPVIFTSCMSVSELGMRRGRKPWLLDSPCGYQQNCLATKTKVVASTVLNYSASYVLYGCILKFDLWEGNAETSSPFGASFLVYLIFSVQTCYPVSS